MGHPIAVERIAAVLVPQSNRAVSVHIHEDRIGEQIGLLPDARLKARREEAAERVRHCRISLEGSRSPAGEVF